MTDQAELIACYELLQAKAMKVLYHACLTLPLVIARILFFPDECGCRTRES